jgi:hypothetical protein
MTTSMYVSRTAKAASMLAILAVMSACAGGGGGEDVTSVWDGPASPDGYTSLPVLDGLDAAVLASHTSTTYDTHRPFDDAASTRVDDFVVGDVQFVSGGADGYETLWATFDTDGDGVLDDPTGGEIANSFNTTVNPYDETYDRVWKDTGEVDVGGQTALWGSAYDNHFVYAPKDEAGKMYAAMTGGDIFGEHNYGIFGRRTTETEMSAQSGVATYEGIIAGGVDRSYQVYAWDLGEAPGDGSVVGGMSASVDFATRAVTVAGNMDYLAPTPSTDTSIVLAGSGSFDAAGRVTGTFTTDVTLRGSTVGGNMQGRFYGPDADTLGVALSAHHREVYEAGLVDDVISVDIAATAIMNRQ